MGSRQSSYEASIRRVSRPVKRVGEKSELSTTEWSCTHLLLWCFLFPFSGLTLALSIRPLFQAQVQGVGELIEDLITRSVPDPNDVRLMIDHAGSQADCRSRRGACKIGGQKGRHIPHFFQCRTPAQKIATHPTLSPCFGAFLKLRVGSGERLVGRAFRPSRVQADGPYAMWPQLCCQQA